MNTANDKKVYNTYLKILPIIVLFIALMGIDVPRGEDVYMKVGGFNVRPYNYGLFIEPANSALYYNVSPFNFYYENNVDEQSIFGELTSESPESSETTEEKDHFLAFSGEISQEAKLRNSKLKLPILLYKTAKSYFGLENPTSTFSNTSVEANRRGNTLIFRPHKTGRDLDNLIMTFSFNEKDIIFDETGSLYTDFDQEIAQDFNKLFDFSLETSETSEAFQRGKVPDGVQNMFVFNETTPGIFKLQINNQKQQLKQIDFENNIMEFRVLDKNDTYLEVQVFDSVKKGLHSD